MEPTAEPPARYSALPTHSVRVPLLRQRWETLSLLHWPYPPDVVQALLPDGLRVETRNGAAWVGLVPFQMTISGPVGPALPWLRAIPETNVRTYVVGPGGRSGVWFLSLDISSIDAVIAGRAWGVPYFWSRMSVTRSGNEVAYRCRRRFGRHPTSEIGIRIGERIDPAEIEEFEHFLTARFALWSRPVGIRTRTLVDHARWPLARATVTRLDDSLVTAAGLPAPTGEPIVHFSAGVRARIGLPGMVSRGRTG
jgi:uncharacterized protein YqjF (DUF2071 family)